MTIEGKKVYLSSIDQSDLENLRNWRNQEEYRKYFREYREINRDMQLLWYKSKVVEDPNTIMFAIRSKKDDELLGCCGLCYVNWVNRHADLSLYIGYNGEYIDNVGIAQEACELLFNYGFRELNLHKIWSEIYEFDTKKHELYQVLGFSQDGTLREQYFYDGKWWNSHIFSIINTEWINL